MSFRDSFLAVENPANNDPLKGRHSRSHQKSLMPAGNDATDHHGDTYSLWCSINHPTRTMDQAQVGIEAEEETGAETGVNEGQSERDIRETGPTI